MSSAVLVKQGSVVFCDVVVLSWTVCRDADYLIHIGNIYVHSDVYHMPGWCNWQARENLYCLMKGCDFYVF